MSLLGCTVVLQGYHSFRPVSTGLSHRSDRSNRKTQFPQISYGGHASFLRNFSLKEVRATQGCSESDKKKGE